MSQTRRGFFRTLGLGSAGLLSSSYIIGYGREAMSWGNDIEQPQPTNDAELIKLSSNENMRGPSLKTMEALHRAITIRLGRGYPPDYTLELVSTVADTYAVEPENVIIGTGSSPILQATTLAFCSPTRGLVTAAPTYGTPAATARQMGFPIKEVPLNSSFELDLDAMADAVNDAGMVFVCNPNNPTGTVHTASDIAGFVRHVKRNSPDTLILLDEAYIDYALGDPEVQTAAPLALEYPGVMILRTFSKAHGMAGLRLGYSIGSADSLRKVGQAWGLGSVNTLSAAAGIASLSDVQHLNEERLENTRVREFTLSAFRDMGFEATASKTNFVFINIRRPASIFRDGTLKQGVRVGRDFPPMENNHARVSLGTMEDMQKAVQVFRNVLTRTSESGDA